MTVAQCQRPCNSFQLVAGRPSHTGKPTLSSSCNVERSTRTGNSSIWLMRSPTEATPNPYVQCLVDGVGLRTRYSDNDSYAAHPHITGEVAYNSNIDMKLSTGIVDCLVHLSSGSTDEFDDFEDSDSDTGFDSDSQSESESDSEAQYITIPAGSPWWKAPQSPDTISFDNLADSHSESDDDEKEDAPSSHSLSDVLQQQQLLIGVFHDELRRIIPGDTPYEYNDSWLQEVDAKLLLAPTESFEDSFMNAMTSPTRCSSEDRMVKPNADVPIDFDDDATTADAWEWEYPLHACRVTWRELESHLPL